VDASDKLISVADTCERLGLKTSAVYKLLRAGQLHAVKVGRLTRIPAASVEAYAASLPTAKFGRQRNAPVKFADRLVERR